MNIQIFGTSKCFDTKKAERYFKERGVKFQMIGPEGKRNEPRRVREHRPALGGWEQMVDPAAKDKQTLACWTPSWTGRKRISSSREPAALQDAHRPQRPHKATVGYQPDVWKIGNKTRFQKTTPPDFAPWAKRGILKVPV